VIQGKGQSGHTTHGRSHDRVQLLDAKMIENMGRTVGNVFDREHRKGQAVGLLGCRVKAGSASATKAAAQGIHADDKIPVSV